MKALPTLALNLVFVSVGLAAYHVATLPVAEDDGAAVAALEDRVIALEERVDALGERRGERRDTARTTDLFERLSSLERRLAASEASPSSAGDGIEEAVVAAARAGDDRPTDAETGDPIADADVERVRKLMDKAEEQRRREHTMGRVDELLTRLEIQLDEGQKERLAKELEAFRENARDRMRAAFQSGLGREEAFATLDAARAELTESLSEFIPASDAEAIAAGTGFGPGGGGRGGGGFGRGR